MKVLVIALCGILSVATSMGMSDGGKGEEVKGLSVTVPVAVKYVGNSKGLTMPRARVVTGNPGGKDEISSTLRAKVKATPSAALRATVQAAIAASKAREKVIAEEGAELPE